MLDIRVAANFPSRPSCLQWIPYSENGWANVMEAEGGAMDSIIDMQRKTSKRTSQLIIITTIVILAEQMLFLVHNITTYVHSRARE